jgi:hypothetical protein
MIAGFTEAQNFTDSLVYFRTSAQPNFLYSSLEKQLNTYYLNSGFNYFGEFNKLSLTVRENYHSTFIQTNDKNIRDENAFLLSTGYKLDSLINFKLSLSNTILSDNRKIEINQASISNIIFLTRISPLNEFSISPFAGYSNNRQKLESDYGPVYGIGGSIERLTFTDLVISSELLFRNEDISPRKNFNRLINLNAYNDFGNSIENNLNARFSESRKDFYYDADSITSERFDIKNNIQSRTETSYLLQNNLFYAEFFNTFSLDVTGRVLWRSIDRNTKYKIFAQPGNAVFDTDINELKMDFESGLSYSGRVHRSFLKLQFSQRDEKHITQQNPDVPINLYEQRSEQEKRKNNTSGRASLLLSSDINLSSKDRINFSFLQNKLTYDTPSEENFDDRDEVLSIARIRYSRFLNPFFEFFASLEGNYSHIVYIFSEQSSNNNINRILKLNSGGTYKGSFITSHNSFEVSANYTVYDFEDINPTYRSYSFRQFSATDSTVIRITKKISTAFSGYLRISEQGDLKWRSFSTRLNRFLREIYAEPSIRYEVENIRLSAGLRIFSLETFLYREQIRIPDSKYISVGPVFEGTLAISNRLSSRLFTWYEFITLNSLQKKEQINMNLEVEWNF